MNKSYTRTKRLTILSMLVTMSILLQIIEPVFPLPVPGVKLGLANIMGLITLYMFSYKEMIGVNVLRVVLASMLRGIIFQTAFWLSLSGVLLSTFAVIILRKITPMSIIGLSVASSVFHCLGQIIGVMFIYQTVYMVSYLPVMWIMSIPAGLLTGTISIQVLKRIK